MKVVIGTRGSRLALIQTNWVADRLKEVYSDICVDVKVISTKGDRILDVALDKIGDKGLFTKEIEDAILAGEVDFSVNSMKDMPSVLPDGLCITACKGCQDERDALVTRHDISNFEDLPENSVVATGSKRRLMQIKAKRADIEVCGIRGNVETRINRMIENDYDGVILAMAGLNRLGIKRNDINIVPLSLDVMLPAPCQGILALEMRENDAKINELLKPLQDDLVNVRCEVEREFMKEIDGGCHSPTGCYARIFDDEVILTGLFGTDNKISRKTKSSKIQERSGLAKSVAHEIIEELGL